MGRTFAAVLAATTLVACAAPPPQAPSDLGELSLYLFAQYESDEAVVADGLRHLDDVLHGLDLDWDAFDVEDDREGRQWSPPRLMGSDLSGVDVPGNPEAQLPVAVASVSDHPVSDHAALVALPDQTPIEASSSVAYDRELLTDVDCFITGDCDRVETYDTIHRENILVDVWYEVTKSYLWVDLPDDGGRAMIARSWAPEVFTGASGTNSIDQSYNLAIWLPHPRGTLRYQALWSSWTIPALDNDDLVISTTAEGMDERYRLTEQYLAVD